MRTRLLFMTFALAFSLLSAGCCADGKVNPTSTTSKPVFDRDIATTEKDILRKHGEPQQTVVKRARELVGELRSALRTKVPNAETEVKELYYKSDKGERIFWLTKQTSGEWTVISDVDIPPGWVF